MELIADMLLIAAALGAGIYCVTLSRRLTRFNSLENGMGGAIAVLSAQVDGMTRTLQQAQKTAESERQSLTGLTGRAEDVAKKLELLVAAMHDLPGDEDTAELAPVDGIIRPKTARAEAEPPVVFSSSRTEANP